MSNQREHWALGTRRAYFTLAFAVVGFGMLLALRQDWHAWAQPPAKRETLEFIRVQIPKARLHEIAQQHPPNYYMPMKREQFETALAKLRTNQEPVVGARIDNALYTARWLNTADGASLQGQGEWAVELDGSDEAILPIGECGLALRSLWWDAEETGEAEEVFPAELGLDDQQRLSLIVPREGVVTFDWSLRGETSGEGDVFQLTLPNATAKTLLLALPKTVVPVVDVGVAAKVNLPYDASQYPSWTTLEPTKDEQIWLVELGAVVKNRLLLQPPDAGPKVAPSYRQQVVYRLGLGGMELQAELQFDDELPSELLLSVGPDLRVDARLGETVVPLENAGPQQMLLRLPQGRGDTTVRLLAVSELPLDTLWTLPKIGIANAAWREGESRIILADQVRLRHLIANECRQTDRRRQRGGREELRFREATESASLQVDVGNRRRELQSRSGISIRWGQGQLSAITECEFRTDWGDIFALQFRVPPGWQVDSVNTEPQDALDLAQLQLQPRQGVLFVPLVQAVSPQSPIRVRIQSHRDVFAGAEVSGKSLLVGQPTDEANEGYLSFQGEVFNDASLSRINPNDLRVAGLIQPAVGSIVVRDDGLGDVMIRKPPARPEYRADVKVRGLPEVRKFTERYEIRCVPDSGAIGRVRIQTSEPIGQLRWSVDGEENVSVSLVEDEAGGSAGDSSPPDMPTAPTAPTAPAAPAIGRRWDLLLSPPLSEPFTLRASREQPWQDGIVLNLLSAPEAISQTGIVEIANTKPVMVEASGLEKLPIRLSNGNLAAANQAAFRYEPATPAPIRIERLDEISTDSNTLSSATAHAWSSHLLSRFETSGVAQHLLNLLVENQGVESLLIEVPENCTVLRVTVDQQPVTPVVQEQRFRLRLPSEKLRVPIQVTYRSHDSRIGWRGELAAPLLRFSIPVLESQWTVDLPPGYDLAESGFKSGRNNGRPRGVQRFFARLALPFSNLQQHSSTQADGWRRGLMLLHKSSEIKTWGDLLQSAERRVNNGAPRLYLHAASLAALKITPDTPLSDEYRTLAEYGLGVFNCSDGVRLTHISRRPQAYGEETLQDVVSISQWTSLSMHPVQVFELPDQAQIDQNRLRRDQVISAQAIGRRQATIRVRDVASVRALMLALLLATAGIAWRVPVRNTFQWWAIGWLAAWLADVPWAWCGVAVGWGALLGMLLRIVRVPAIGERAGGLRLAGSFAALAAAVACATLLAQDGDQGKKALYRVLIPLDEEGAPLEDYSVPLPIWRAFEEADRENKAAAIGWLLTSADYELSRDETLANATPAQDVLTLTTTFRLRVFRPNEQIRLPMDRSDGPVVTAVLDGVDTNFRWDAAGKLLQVSTTLPGFYELIITRRLAGDLNQGVSVEVPRVPTATMSLEEADSLWLGTLPNAWGETTRNAGRVVSQLGGVSAVSINRQHRRDGGARQVEEHLWLEVKRVNSIVLHSLFRYQAVEDVGQVRLRAERRLRFLNMQLDGEDVTPNVEETSEGTIVTLDLPEGKRTAEVTADFHFKGVYGIGRVRPPELVAMSHAAVRRWFAISVGDPGLQAEFAGDATMIDSDQFTVSWPTAKGPLRAVKTDSGEFDVVIRYREQQPMARQVTEVTATRLRSIVDFEAEVTELRETFQHVLRLPDAMNVESLEVLEGGVAVQQRHEVDADGVLSIFLDRPASATQTIRLRGWAPATLNRKLPTITMRSAGVESRRIELYRAADVGDVEILQPRNLAIDEQQAGRFARGRRLVAVLSPEAAVFSARLRVQPNQRRVSSETTIIVKRRSTQWYVELRGEFSVTAGVMDGLRFRAPPNVTPSVVQPETMTLTPVIDIEGHWRLIPEQPVSEQLEVVVEFPISPGDDGVLRAPDLAFLDIVGRRFLALPRAAEGRQIRWATPRGLQAFNAAEFTLDDLAFDLYEIVDRRFEATLRRTERSAGALLVALADVQFHREGMGGHGSVAFDIEPAGRDVCEVDTHSQCELLGVVVNGIPAPATRKTDDVWRVSLGANDLPQRVTVYFRSRPNSTALWAPTMSGVDTVRTLWSVTGNIAEEDIAASPLNDSQIELWRTESICTLLGSAADVAGNHPVDEAKNWYEPWARRLLRSERKLARLPLNTEDEARAASFTDLHERAAEQLRMSPALEKIRSESYPADASTEVKAGVREGRRPLSFATQGPASHLKLRPVALSVPSRGNWAWLLASSLVVLLTFRLDMDQWLAQWPDLFLAGIGVVLMIGWSNPWFGSAVLALAMLRSMNQRD